jgi:DAACS family dicarboxylate/amino acid:cation (Na+ or H+) symporter
MTPMSLHTRILLGLVFGAAAGVGVNSLVPPEWRAAYIDDGAIRYVFQPIGQIFLNLLILTVIPLVFASLSTGVARLGGGESLGRVGLKTFGYFLITTIFAAVIGLTLTHLIRPGEGLPAETRDSLLEAYRGKAQEMETKSDFGIDTFVKIVPRNPLKAAVDFEMLSVIFVALLVGIGLTRINRDRSRLLLTILDGVNDIMVFIIDLAMKFAPYGVFSLIFVVTAKFGADVLKQLGFFVATVLIGLCIQLFVVFPILIRFLGRMNPLVFFRQSWPIAVTAFSTSSSNATLPTSIKVSEENLGVAPPIAGFVLPLGATVNMNGTALFEGVTVLFIAQVFGIHLDLTQQIVVVLMSVLMAVGAAGVPGGSIPLLAIVLRSVGVPPEGIALIIGVDRLPDMCRTVVNVLGDVTAAVFVARSEGMLNSTERIEPANGANDRPA